MGIIDFTAVYQIVLFLVLWAILDRVLFRPYLRLLDERERRTGGARTEIADLQTKAERLRAQYQEKISVAEAEARAAPGTEKQLGVSQTALKEAWRCCSR